MNTFVTLEPHLQSFDPYSAHTTCMTMCIAHIIYIHVYTVYAILFYSQIQRIIYISVMCEIKNAVYRISLNKSCGVYFLRKVLRRRLFKTGIYLLAYNRGSLTSHKLISKWNLRRQRRTCSPVLSAATTSARQF